ncbi:tripartite motif-containing protein 14 [Scleropages formosus]|uniref:tripartite motif-containing protein 14 n=1 Tax=Scleropages formosus TaxID=113540 RepID=UPI000878BBD3|nr:tripartite motif-containing protein 14-like [Scleropages formosus]
MATMGGSLGSPSDGPTPVCPLCHEECRRPTRLRCGHCFCHGCIQELWSGSPTGPYYCPECRDEYGKLPAFGSREAETPQGSVDRSPGVPPRSPTAAQANSEDIQPSCSASLSHSSPPHLGKRSSRSQNSFSPTNSPSTSSNAYIICHYCPPTGTRRTAVKTCLVCGASMCTEHLQPHLESPVFQNHTLVAPQADISVWRCQEHQEVNKIYCQECAVCVCTVCTVIGTHRNHSCISVTDAERELRKDLQKEMKKMQEKEQAVQTTVTELKEKKRSIQVLLGKAKDGVQQQYRAIREALEREEHQALQCASREEQRAVGVIEAQLEWQQDVLRLIQHATGTLEHLSDAKASSGIQNQAFVAEYSKVITSLDGIPDLSEDLEVAEVDEVRLEQLQAWAVKRLNAVVFGPHDRDALRLLCGVIPSLNEDTAHPKLILSENSRKVTYCEEPQPYPELSTRFSIFPQVLATHPREGGRSYWEVEVMGEGRWKVGVCEARIHRKGADDACRMGFNPHSWCLYGERDKIEALHDKIAVPLPNSPLQRVGVYLDLEEGCLSFYSVTQDGAFSLLHSFHHEFTQPLFPALAVSKAQLAFCDLFPSTAVE